MSPLIWTHAPTLLHFLSYVDLAVSTFGMHTKAVPYRAIRDSGIPRGSIFVTSKLSPYEQGSQKAMEAIDKMIDTLGALCKLRG